MQEVNFLFLDEAYRKETKIFSMTGLLVPASKYSELRRQFYEIIGKYHYDGAGNIDMTLVELHGKNMLPGRSNEEKLSAFRQVADLVLKNEINVFRIGHHVTKDNVEVFQEQQDFRSQTTHYRLCWFNLLRLLEPFYQQAMLIPVMDGFDSKYVNIMSEFLKQMDIARESGIDEMYLTFQNTANISEVFYADSRFSFMTQICDVISCLRNVEDWKTSGVEMSEFRRELFRIARDLDTEFLHEFITPFEVIKQQPSSG